MPSDELLLVEGCGCGPAFCGLGEVFGVGGAGVWSPSGDSRSFSSYCSRTSSNCVNTIISFNTGLKSATFTHHHHHTVRDLDPNTSSNKLILHVNYLTADLLILCLGPLRPNPLCPVPLRPVPLRPVPDAALTRDAYPRPAPTFFVSIIIIALSVKGESTNHFKHWCGIKSCDMPSR